MIEMTSFFSPFFERASTKDNVDLGSSSCTRTGGIGLHTFCVGIMEEESNPLQRKWRRAMGFASTVPFVAYIFLIYHPEFRSLMSGSKRIRINGVICGYLT
ncbi:hypothetical protein SISSUDRAFT_489974 [Sistotremastrum suecicum HHB10207 ss-3]|uniref:Uncharacterized protein n=1 Tax=Sistotremastrum suecicum HHB10207 ss-3 TaxID=1314776 RepID=A0A165XZJ5_9AGAM|nr:hypothetical protein SISSUDRAFT_489974 [Sistotremastrum suecicum HHB10207 ss-3]